MLQVIFVEEMPSCTATLQFFIFKNCQTSGKDDDWNVDEMCSTHNHSEDKKQHCMAACLNLYSCITDLKTSFLILHKSWIYMYDLVTKQ